MLAGRYQEIQDARDVKLAEAREKRSQARARHRNEYRSRCAKVKSAVTRANYNEEIRSEDRALLGNTSSAEPVLLAGGGGGLVTAAAATPLANSLNA